MPESELHVPRDVQYVGLARLVVALAARQAGMGDERVADLKIAVSEVAASAMRAGRGGEDEEPVRVLFGAEDDCFEVTIAAVAPVVGNGESRARNEENGLRAILVRHLADEADVEAGATTRVRMRFELA